MTDTDQPVVGSTSHIKYEDPLRGVISAAGALVCALGASLVFANAHSPLRPWVVLVGLVLGSGWAVVGWLDLALEAAFVGALTLGAGVAVPIALSIILVVGGWWHPIGASGALLVAAAAVNLLLGLRSAVRVRQSRPRGASQ